MTFEKQFKKSFSYTWYLYLLAIAIPAILFPLSYSFMHRPKEYETLSIFIPTELKDKKAEDTLLSKFKENGVRKVDIIYSNPNDQYTFSNKLAVVGYNTCDLIFLPEGIVEKTGIHTAALELTSEVKIYFNIEEEKTYVVQEKEYGIELNENNKLDEISTLEKDTKYYVFINGASANIGQFSNKKTTSENCVKLLHYFLGK